MRTKRPGAYRVAVRDLVLLVVGALLGVAMSAVFFQATPQPWFRRAKGRARAKVRELAPASGPSTWSTSGRLRIGAFQADWHAIDGDGRTSWAAPAGRIHLASSTPCPTDPRFEDLVLAVQHDLDRERAAGAPTTYDTQGIAIANLVIRRTDDDEEIASTAEAVPCSYLQFRAKLRGLTADDRRIAPEELIPRPGAPSTFNPFLLSHAGVAVAVVTSDHQLVLARRKPFGPRPGELDCSVVEGINLRQDRSTHDRTELVAADAMRRGLAEELGVMPEDTAACDVLAVGIDLDYAQWNWTGMARLSITGEQLRAASDTASDRFENELLELVDFAPAPVLERLHGERIWACGLATIYYSLVYSYGKRPVDREAERISFAASSGA